MVHSPVRLIDAPSFASQFEDIFIFEAYSFPCDDPAPTIVDLGANVGSGVWWWKGRWPASRIEAYEPDPDAFSALSWNTRSLPNVNLHNKAVFAPGMSAFFLPTGGDAGHLVTEAGDDERLIPVETIRLGEILEPLGRVDLLKIDIEGAETPVLLDAEENLGRVSRIFVEYHSVPTEVQTLDKILAMLTRTGFRYGHLGSSAGESRPFYGTGSPDFDLQVNVFAWRP